MKKIILEYGEETFTLRFSRDSILAMERAGVHYTDLWGGLSDSIDVFYWALKEEHPTMSKEKAKEIFYALDDKGEVVKTLLEMMKDVYEDAYGKPSKNSKKAKWTVE